MTSVILTEHPDCEQQDQQVTRGLFISCAAEPPEKLTDM